MIQQFHLWKWKQDLEGISAFLCSLERYSQSPLWMKTIEVSPKEWIVKKVVVYIYTMEKYLWEKEILPYETIWMNHENIMQVNKSEKDK